MPITYEVLANHYKGWVERTGRDSQDHTLHGLRRGGTNHALTIGLCGEDIQLMGGWASQAYLQYIDLTVERRITNVKFIDEMDNMINNCDDWDDVKDFRFVITGVMARKVNKETQISVDRHPDFRSHRIGRILSNDLLP